MCFPATRRLLALALVCSNIRKSCPGGTATIRCCRTTLQEGGAEGAVADGGEACLYAVGEVQKLKSTPVCEGRF
jgi:hypothetical protein